MSLKSQPMTGADLLRLPDDGFCYELVKGELRKTLPAGMRHGLIAMNVSAPLASHVRLNNLGEVYAAETGFLIASNPDTVRAPDCAFLSRSKLEEVGAIEGYWPGAPVLVIEVISPNDNYSEDEEKVLEWLEAGALMVVLVNPRKETVTVYRSLTDILVLTEKDVLDGGEVVPGWTIAIKEIFG